MLDYNHIDEALNDAYLDAAHPLSSLRKPSTNRGENNGATLAQERKKRKTNHYSSILFVKLKVPSGKKGRGYKTRTIKALLDSGAS